MKWIREKSLYFLSTLDVLCKHDTSKEYNIYGIGKELKYKKAEIEYIVEYLTTLDLIVYKKSSYEASITPKGVEILKSKRPIEYLIDIKTPAIPKIL